MTWRPLPRSIRWPRRVWLIEFIMPLTLKQQRFITRTAFFILFLLAPLLNIFRLDLYEGNFILFGFDWTLGLAPFQRGEASALEAAWNILYRVFIPVLSLLGLGVWIVWRYGRIYCGWLCPHFSVVESINRLMVKASGKPTIWESQPLPGSAPAQAIYWLWTLLAAVGIGFLWAVSLLTYLLPPEVIYHNLFAGELTRNQALFIGVATLLFTFEFIFARHLFCRYGCAVGLFQSIIWLANDRAMVVTFDKSRGDLCKDCLQDCDNACPMRLQPRKRKRHMFTCTQCSECIQACDRVQQGDGLLRFKSSKVIPIKKWESSE